MFAAPARPEMSGGGHGRRTGIGVNGYTLVFQTRVAGSLPASPTKLISTPMCKPPIGGREIARKAAENLRGKGTVTLPVS